MQQGELDGMCGVYAIVHFLRRFQYFRGSETTEYEESPERLSFECVLETAERLGLLRASSLYNGFDGHQLRSIIDQIIHDLELPLKTHLIPTVANALGINKFKDFAIWAISNKGSLIANYSRGNHWVWVHQHGPTGFIIENSSGIDPADQRLTPQQCGKIELLDGVVILPKNVIVSGL